MKHQATRRDFNKLPAGAAAASAVTVAMKVPHVFAAEDNAIRLALIGCGGRGSGAALNALGVKSGPTKLVAMADVFDERIKQKYESIKKRCPEQVDVPDDRKFIGFDAYQKAMDCLRPGDVAILTTPLAFRGVMFQRAIEKGLHVFMEKPVIADGPSARRMLALAEQAKAKNLKVGVGLMCRHCKARGELLERIKGGEIGEIIALRAYRMHHPGGFVTRKSDQNKNDKAMTELLWQIRHFHSFLWASGGIFSDYYIHNIDECCWMKGAWPVQAQALGGRHYRGEYVDQNFDAYSVEYTFPDGTKLFLDGRCMDQCYNEFASYAHGTKSMAVISTQGHTPAKCRIYRNHVPEKENLAWAFPQPEPNPYDLEWEDLISAIHSNAPYNEVKRGVEASVVTSMGRMAAHTGQVITFDQMLNCEHEFAPDVDKFTMTGPAPILADAEGKYPVPQPGKTKTREY